MENNVTVPNEEAKVKTTTAVVGKGQKKVPFAVVEAYKTIRTNLSFLLPKNGCKSFVVSSPNPGEGKSTTVINTAIAFSQLGKRVLLIDADMRRPSIHKKLKLLNTKGLFSVLLNPEIFDESIQNINPNFDVLTSGPLPPNPAEMLASEALSDLLDSLEEKYDYIIFDSTPINVVSDALALAPKVNGLLLVVRDGCTSKEDVHHALEACKFANVRLLGAVLNGVNTRTRGKYLYRKKYYNYRYQYNYSYTSNSSLRK